MINKRFFQKLKKDHEKTIGERRQIISLANTILHDSKRSIFALHRGDKKKAIEDLIDIEKRFKHLEKKFGFKRINQEGAYKAGAEEYVEAKMFYNLLNNKKLSKIDNLNFTYDTYLGGICDTTGELVRMAVNLAAKGDFKEVTKIKRTIQDIINELIQFDMAGYLRTKFDQAKGNLRKIEQLDYEIKIRQKE